MAKATRIYLPAESPKELGLEGEPLRFIVWANSPQALLDSVWDVFTDDGAKRVHAFQQLLERSEPQTVETDTGEIVLDFRTVEATQAALTAELPDDIATWLVNLPHAARMARRDKIAELLPLSYGPAKR